MIMNEAATTPISRYPIPPLADLPEDLRAKILEVQEKAGFVPNVFLAFAHRPAEFRAFFAYHDALLLRDSGLSKGEKEMIIVATSGANQCLYCVVAHGAILRIYEKEAPRRRPGGGELPQGRHQRATEGDARLRDEGLQRLGRSRRRRLRGTGRHGFSLEDAWDIAGITALFGLSNRMANFTSMRPNDEFYLMGRVPKDKRPA
jgi:AhpD family alkylhydroperoxidase